MLVADVRQLDSVSRFCYWITEREAIRQKKLAGQPLPWTDDEILQQYRFCNVRRMDDAVSNWLLSCWYQPYFNHQNMLAACCLARFFNLPATLEAIGFPERWEPQRIKTTLARRKKAGQKIFNSAYMVRGNDGPDKVASVVDYTIQPLIDNPPLTTPSSMRRTHAALAARYSFGSFMAGQVTADAVYAIKGTWRDRRNWAPLGPGSRRGINRLLGNPLNATMSQSDFLSHLTTLILLGRQNLPKQITKRLDAIDWQNATCEFDKYSRVLLGEGRPKQRYNGLWQ